MNRGIWNLAFVFGLVFMAIGVFMLVNYVLLSFRCTERTEGLVVDGDIWKNENELMLTFSANGDQYRLPFSYSNKMTVGTSVTVAYNPEKIETYLNSFYILEDVPNTKKMAVICIGGGIIAMLVGYGVSIGLIEQVWLF